MGRYYKSAKAYMNATGKSVNTNAPNIHVTGSVKGIRRFWGKDCDVVRVGRYIYMQ